MDVMDVVKIIIIVVFVELYFTIGWYFFGKEENESYFSNPVRLRGSFGLSLALSQMFFVIISWPAMVCLIFVGIMVLGSYDLDGPYDY